MHAESDFAYRVELLPEQIIKHIATYLLNIPVNHHNTDFGHFHIYLVTIPLPLHLVGFILVVKHPIRSFWVTASHILSFTDPLSLDSLRKSWTCHN